jgi:hypothetical protein
MFSTVKMLMDSDLVQLITNAAPQMSPANQNPISTTISSDRALKSRRIIDYGLRDG